MKLKTRMTAAILAAFFMIPLLCGTALAAPLEPDAPEEVSEEIVITEEDSPFPVTGGYDPDAPAEPTPNPFTRSGTGTVIDNATDADGKEFYTIMAPDENVFYLVIDRQRGTENVYFLNAVTVADLLALAELSETPPVGSAPAEPTPTLTEPEPDPVSAPEQDSGGNIGMIILLVAVMIIGGGAGWYFKIYRPKQQRAGNDEDYYDEPDSYGADDSGQYDDGDAEPEDDGPPWYDDDESPNEDSDE